MSRLSGTPLKLDDLIRESLSKLMPWSGVYRRGWEGCKWRVSFGAHKNVQSWLGDKNELPVGSPTQTPGWRIWDDRRNVQNRVYRWICHSTMHHGMLETPMVAFQKTYMAAIVSCRIGRVLWWWFRIKLREARRMLLPSISHFVPPPPRSCCDRHSWRWNAVLMVLQAIHKGPRVALDLTHVLCKSALRFTRNVVFIALIGTQMTTHHRSR